MIFNLIQPLDPYRTVEVGFAGAAAVLSGLLYALYRSPHPVTATRSPRAPRASSKPARRRGRDRLAKPSRREGRFDGERRLSPE